MEGCDRFSAKSCCHEVHYVADLRHGGGVERAFGDNLLKRKDLEGSIKLEDPTCILETHLLRVKVSIKVVISEFVYR